MNVWLGLATVLLVALLGLGVGCARAGDDARGLVAVQLSGVVGTMLLLLLARGLGRTIYYELPLVFALLSFVGVVAFLRLRGGRL